MADRHGDPDEGGEGGTTRAVRRRGPNRIAVIAALVMLGILLVGFLTVWVARRPIAEGFIERELQSRGVEATYRLDRVGLHNQIISNVVIGDPRHPDLIARYAQVQMRIKWNGGVEVYRIVARGVRLRGRLLRSGRVSWGEVDKMLPPPSGQPFRLPDVVLDVADSQITLNSPYGRLGFAVAGAGNLTGGFKGRLAAASSRLVPGLCQVDRLKASVAIAVVARRPHVVGPVLADRFACPASQIRFTGLRADIDSDFSEAFASFNGKGRLHFMELIAGTNGLAHVDGDLTFMGEPTKVRGRVNLAAQRARLATIYADRTRVRGDYLLDATSGNLALVAEYGATSVAVDKAVIGGLAGPLDAAAGTPLGPVARAIAAAIRRTAAGFDASGSLRVVNFPGGGAVRIESADARGPGGARVQVSGGDGVTYYWPSGRIRIDGDIAMRGGGLPTAELSLSQPRGGGAMTGEARIAPYSAGGARVALAPVTFRGARDGSTGVHTIVLLDGPFSGGRVRGLRIPINGSIGGRAGGFAFGRGCIEAGFQSLQAGSLRLGASRFPLCPTGPAILYQRGDGPLAVGAATRNLRLAGRLGQSPFRLTAAQARLLGSDRFAATRLAIELGRTEAPVKFDASNLTGRFIRGGAAGNFTDATAIIGRVPLQISDAAGKWNFRNNALDIDGAMTVAHLADAPKFYPLRSDDVRFRLANDMIRTTGTLKHPASGARVTDATVSHRLSTGVGEAILDVPGIRFGQGLQPEELTRLTQGVIALVNGTLRGQGRIAWNGKGAVTSTGDFSTDGMDLAASFGPITGLRGTMHFTDLLGLETAPGQRLAMTSINPGILVENGEITYQVLPGQLVRIERGEWPFMGGRLILRETVLNFGRPSPKRLTFEVVGLDAKIFVDSLGFKELGATGIFVGVLPMIFDDQGGRIVGGRLDSRPPGGSLAYNGVVNRANLGMMGNITFDALRDLRFRSMIVRLDGDLAGEFATRLTIDGVALGQTGTQKIIRSLLRRLPLKLNVTIKGPFRALIATAKSFRDPRNTIRDVLPVPIDQIPGVVTEVRRREEQQTQTQTPVDEKIEVTPKPPSQSE